MKQLNSINCKVKQLRKNFVKFLRKKWEKVYRKSKMTTEIM